MKLEMHAPPSGTCPGMNMAFLTIVSRLRIMQVH
jgi:hypothetical protein